MRHKQTFLPLPLFDSDTNMEDITMDEESLESLQCHEAMLYTDSEEEIEEDSSNINEDLYHLHDNPDVFSDFTDVADDIPFHYEVYQDYHNVVADEDADVEIDIVVELPYNPFNELMVEAFFLWELMVHGRIFLLMSFIPLCHCACFPCKCTEVDEVMRIADPRGHTRIIFAGDVRVVQHFTTFHEVRILSVDDNGVENVKVLTDYSEATIVINHN
ncbi:MAG: E7fs protein [Melanogrammus aeglefinus-associated papillomavirus 2]|uniref:E7fs protein n=1 Tax=Papillomaviridae sp. TaxID=2052558 RepID=A0A8F5XQ65_9PAPI|nr:MAG: E7fs protein [Melanogrammus aeglefinus-associated papillomavirus 2]